MAQLSVDWRLIGGLPAIHGTLEIHEAWALKA